MKTRVIFVNIQIEHKSVLSGRKNEKYKSLLDRSINKYFLEFTVVVDTIMLSRGKHGAVELVLAVDFTVIGRASGKCLVFPTGLAGSRGQFQ